MEGDGVGALQTLSEAKALDPELPEIYHSEAIALHGKRDYESALLHVNKALSLAPSYTEAKVTRGKILMDLGRYQDAQVDLLSVTKDHLYRDSFKAWINLGVINYRLEHDAEAKKFLQEALVASPNKACLAHYYLGHIALRAEAFKDAIRNYQQASIRGCAKIGDAKVALGIALTKNKQFELARKTFLEIQKLYPEHADQAMEKLKELP